MALILAPGTYSRNKFYSLFEEEELRHARRRAQMIRSLVKELTEPWEHRGKVPGRSRPELIEKRESEGMVHLSYVVSDFVYQRSVSLTPVEYAALCYALKQAGHGEVSDEQRHLVEEALKGLAPPQTSEP